MAKGQIATLIIILVVIGAVVYFALPTLQNLPLGGTGGGGGTIQINNNIITVESYSVSSLKMFPSDQTVVSFLVQNNGDHEVKPTVDLNNNGIIPNVNFYDLGGMSLVSLTCGDNVNKSLIPCTFDLKPFESMKIILRLQAPDVGSLTTFKISYSITYPYSGSKSVVIPIIDGITRTTPLGKFAQSSAAYNPDPTKTPSYGPLDLSYSFPATGTTIQNNQQITQYWGVNGQPFRLQLQLKSIGTVSGAQPVRLLSITLSYPTQTSNQNNYLEAADISNNFCPINDNVNSRIKQESNPNFIGPPSISQISSSTPFTLNCQFIPHIATDIPETTVQVSTTFSYDYTILRSETFTVQPLAQKS